MERTRMIRSWANVFHRYGVMQLGCAHQYGFVHVGLESGKDALGSGARQGRLDLTEASAWTCRSARIHVRHVGQQIMSASQREAPMLTSEGRRKWTGFESDDATQDSSFQAKNASAGTGHSLIRRRVRMAYRSDGVSQSPRETLGRRGHETEARRHHLECGFPGRTFDDGISGHMGNPAMQNSPKACMLDDALVARG